MKFLSHPDGSVVLLPKLPASALRGIVKARRRRVSIEEMDQAVAAVAAEYEMRRKPAMIGLDTNVLVRYIAQDDAIQSQTATNFIERLSERDPGFISVVAMTETAWVLERAYRLSTAEVAKAIERTLQVDALVVESEQEVFTAMIALKEGRGPFADALIGALGATAGGSGTVTFDQRALRLPGFELLSS